ncbi:MAG: DUF5676 family membrane protein [Acidobacteriota bacterium]
MKLDTRAIALATGTVASTLFVLCAIFVAFAPQATIWATRELFHVVVSAAPSITWSGVVAGIVFWFVLAAASAAAVAWLFNRWSTR